VPELLFELPPELQLTKFIVAASNRMKMLRVLIELLLGRSENGRRRIPRAIEANWNPKNLFQLRDAEAAGSLTVRVTFVAADPAAIDGGVIVYVAPDGKPLTESDTADGNVPEPVGLNVRE
jgi:hypothetical protein